MRSLRLPVVSLVTLLIALPAMAANVAYLDAKPLQDVVSDKARPVKTSGKVRLPLITWGGDVATIHALEKGFLKDAGLDVELAVENNFPAQVKATLTGETPYLRGTMGMIHAAAEAFQREGVELTVIYQLTWSTVRDCRQRQQVPPDGGPREQSGREKRGYDLLCLGDKERESIQSGEVMGGLRRDYQRTSF